jgi:hypothetical protein
LGGTGCGLAASLVAVPGDFTISHFSQSNPTGPGQGDVRELLRRVADSIESLGDVDVQDITFATAPTDAEDDLTMTVYFHRQPRRR